MQIPISQLRSTIVEYGGEQTLIKARNVITWNSFTTLKARLI
jgi:hypothetical protein